MSFDTLERSLEEGQPLTLYSFALQGTTWRYSSGAKDEVIGGLTWKAMPMSDDGVKQTGEAATDGLTITAPTVIGPVQLYMSTPPSMPVKVRIYQKDQANNTLVQRYAGEINQIDYPSPGIASIACETLSATMNRSGLTLGWQRTCPYSVYDELTCKVPKANFAVTGRILSSSNGSIGVSLGTAKPDGYFNGGFIEWQHPVRGYETRLIEVHAASAFLIFGPSDDLFPGMNFKAYPGCDLTRNTCVNVFNNLPNNGACKFMPGKSPFDGTPVF